MALPLPHNRRPKWKRQRQAPEFPLLPSLSNGTDVIPVQADK